jgi:asparagine synthase (glutamine-hydrolysing)
VKVALTGDGGDELFAGYPRYRLAPQTWTVARRLPWRLVGQRAAGMTRAFQGLERFSDRFPRPLRERSMGWVAGLLASSSSATTFSEHYRNVRSDTHVPAALLDRDWRNGAAGVFPLGADASECENLLGEMMHADLLSYLPDDILVKVDRAAMSVGLETRIPLLDPAVLDVAWRMPEAVGAGAARDKNGLRQLLARHLPGVDVPREKRGFGVPLAHWLRGPLRDWAQHLISPAALAEVGFLDERAVTALWQRHQRGQNEQHPLWAVLMLQVWALAR